MAKYFGGFILYRIREGVLELLLQGSENTNPEYPAGEVQYKFPGGVCEPVDRDSFETAHRELKEEVYYRLASENRVRHILCNWVSPTHFQDFFSVPEQDCEGEMRVEILYDGKSKLHPPEWVPLWKVRNKVYKTHKPAFRAFVKSARKYGLFNRTGI